MKRLVSGLPNYLKTVILEMIPGIVILAIMMIGGIWQRRNEKREWNGGICAANGKPWRLFDFASDGSRGYEAGGIYVWISHRVDSSANA
jgi:hypothetical protein